MLRKRQSSLCGAVLPGCGQAGPGMSARFVPGSDVGSCGGVPRAAPAGDAA